MFLNNRINQKKTLFSPIYLAYLISEFYKNMIRQPLKTTYENGEKISLVFYFLSKNTGRLQRSVEPKLALFIISNQQIPRKGKIPEETWQHRHNIFKIQESKNSMPCELIPYFVKIATDLMWLIGWFRLKKVLLIGKLPSQVG